MYTSMEIQFDFEVPKKNDAKWVLQYKESKLILK